MDSLITAAARALATGDPLGALKRIALRSDAPALALRGIAMAQLGDLPRARALLRRAARRFGAREPVARARCVVAEAEIALVSRELGRSAKALGAARAVLEARGDRANAAHARFLEVRRLLLLGRIDEAEHALAAVDPAPLPPALRTAHEMVVAGIAMRRLQTRRRARRWFGPEARRGRRGSPRWRLRSRRRCSVLRAPAARLIARAQARPLRLDQVQSLLARKALVVDACRTWCGPAGPRAVGRLAPPGCGAPPQSRSRAGPCSS